MQYDVSGIQIGAVSIAYFGLFLAGGFMLGALLSLVAARQRDEEAIHVLDALSWVILLGIVGARLVHVLAPPPSMVQQGLTARFYLTHLFDVQSGPIALWTGGLNLLGGLAGGLAGLWVYTRRQNLHFARWADIAALGAPLGFAVGSLGNLSNRLLLGPATELPWGISVAGADARYHPLPAYLSLWALLTLAVLQWIAVRHADSLRTGDLLLWFIVLIAPGLFMFDMLRSDKQVLVAGIGWMQMIVGLTGIMVLLWIRVRRRWVVI